MVLTKNTILITGGSSGLGLEMAKKFLQMGNKVIVCSRNHDKLELTQNRLPEVITFQCDISVEAEQNKLVNWIKIYHPDLALLVNNAAIVNRTDFITDSESINKLSGEIATNLTAPIHLIKLLYPVLVKNNNAAVLNITSGLIYTPRSIYPFYNATKSALHAFTQVLRHQLKNEPVKIIEVMFPVVDTPWHQGNTPKSSISVEKAVSEMIRGIERNQREIKVGAVKLLYYLSRIAPKFAFKKINALQ
ncbi:SDR family NAD(P)-dependent oxidoreductase [Niabella yanshanensis]|uniref:SDR family NAD(P)-dependent oxidoreductase n=1 Tax=Niabella yanshanensis TaxID=577386 RepID=A0ABZ0WBM9_9BACT|nr:SDR family NAD(P)-dependent oxidoreductase [Niabella yanshanensis]WQD39929.1 SDR family NAD(P)-dependent oxidoreductase [Niabella yanshanensis]